MLHSFAAPVPVFYKAAPAPKAKNMKLRLPSHDFHNVQFLLENKIRAVL